MSENNHESREEIAAYLLGALEPGEATALERHLGECAECRAELRWLDPAVQLLPEAVQRLEPPAELRSRILAQAGAEAEHPGARDGARAPLFSGWRALTGLGALALVAAAIAGYAIHGGGSSGAGSVTTVIAGKPPGVIARMVRQGDAATLHLANVHQLPRDRVLEAWVRREGRVIPVNSLFVPDRRGRASTRIPDLKGVDVVMVTAEPEGGSKSPTAAPMVTLEVAPS
jgi:anti-sigma-K factor RskA